MEIFTYTPDMLRPECATCGVSVSPCEDHIDTPEIAWKATCRSGHSHMYQLDTEDYVEISGENWLEDSKTSLFSRFATEDEESTWVCNSCDATGADPYDKGCHECGITED